MKKLLQKEWSHYVSEVKTTWTPRCLASQRFKIFGSKSAYDYLIPLWEDIDYVETFYMIHLARNNSVLGHSFISRGGTAGTIADPKIIFQNALGANASAIILAHNHPSGGTVPSEPDKKLCKRINDIGTILDIKLLDNLIVTTESYFSFADHGLIH